VASYNKLYQECKEKNELEKKRCEDELAAMKINYDDELAAQNKKHQDKYKCLIEDNGDKIVVLSQELEDKLRKVKGIEIIKCVLGALHVQVLTMVMCNWVLNYRTLPKIKTPTPLLLMMISSHPHVLTAYSVLLRELLEIKITTRIMS